MKTRFLLMAGMIAMLLLLKLQVTGGNSYDTPGTWLGNTSADWHTASNWIGGVPSSSTDIIIPAGLTNYPVLSAAGICRTIALMENGSSISGPGLLTIDNDACIVDVTGSASISCPIDMPPSPYVNVTGTLTISGIISNITNNWLKTGPGTLILTALNDFGGQSIIQGGTVSINTLENYHINSSLGKPTTAGNGTIEFYGPGGVLQYTGTGHSSNRLINLYHNHGTIEASGSGTLTLTGNVSVYYVAEALALNLGGTANGIENGVIGMVNGSVIKNGSGTWTLGGNNTYGGSTTINAGILFNGATNVIPDRPMVLNGGTYSTGATAGFDEGIGTLALTDNSTIALGTGSHILAFSASYNVTWAAGKMLTITGWQGNWDGSAGTAGKIFFGINSNGLTAAQIAQIQFYNGSINVPATLLSSGELVPSTATYASDYFRTQSSGNWSASGNWQSSHDNSEWITATVAPTSAAALVTILSGNSITVDVASTAGNLVIDGILDGGSSTLSISGDWTNNNIFSASSSTIIFNGTHVLQTISGSSTTNFYFLKVDKGAQDRILEATSTIGLTASNDPLIIASGTFKLSSNSAITPFTGSYIIPASGGLWNNGGIINTGNSVTLTGTALLRNSAGTLNIGCTTNSIKYGDGSTVIIEGGNVNVAGRFVPSGTNPAINYQQSGGTLSLATQTTTTSDAAFDIQNTSSSFTMNGGSIIIQKALSIIADYLNYSSTHNVTGGTIQFGNEATSGSPAFSIRSTAPVWDLLISSVGTPSLKLVTNGLTVKHNLTISAGSTFNFNNEELWLQGNLVNDGITTGTTGYLSFNGSNTQYILGSAQTWVKNLRMNNIAGLDLSGTLPLTITGTLYLMNGIITTGSNYIDMVQYSGVSRTSGHINGNLQKFVFEGTGTYDFEVGGPGMSDYTPVSVTINNVYNIGMLMATTIDGDHPNIGSAAQLIPGESVNRFWKLTNTSVEFTDYSAIFNWQGSNEDDGFDYSAAICGRYSGSSWTYPTIGSKTATSIQITGATGFSDFQVAEACMVAATPVFNGGNASGRLQGATSSTYNATSPNSTSMSYVLDASSLAAGNTINASTGQVNWTAAWTGTSTITATATGCNGSSSANHTVTTISTSGNLLYGLTRKGGSENLGTVFHYDQNTGVQTVDYSAATVNSGASPFWTALTDGGNGKFYGVTRYGGVNNKGVLFEWDPSTNIFTRLYEFATATGSEPQGSLILSGGKLYGLTYNGGTNNMGTIFEYNISTNTYTRKYNFEQLAGKFPFGSLTAYDNKFFGTTTMGGAYDQGVIFEWDPTNNNYTKKIDLLSASTGAYPYASDLILYNGKFYGTTEVGGTNSKGTIFEWDPSNNTFIKKIDLATSSGANPFGSLTLKDGKLYGMTKYGGSNNGGVIFEWDPSSNAYTKKYDFSASTGWLPYGSLTLKDGKFYGLTYEGGANNFGALFEWDPSANSFTKKVDFLPAIGSSPIGSMIMKDGILYGMTITGGLTDKGVIFKYDPAANFYQKKIDFSLSNGSIEMGSLSQYNGKFYGLTSAGGVNNVGTIFELDPASGIYTKKFDLDQANGSVSYSTLAFYNGKFYGMTATGGADNVGVIFEWDPATNVYVKKFDFSEAAGKYPRGALTLYADKFFGLTYTGGSNGGGTIFEWDPTNSTFVKKIDMVQAQGSNPEGSLTLYNGIFYGTTSTGGTNGLGTIFEWNPSSNSYNLKYSLAVADGAGPKSTLALYNGKLYGLTMNGGTNLYGTIFEWDPAINTFTKKIDLVQATGGNPYGSLFLGNNNKFYGMTNLGGTSDLGVIFEWDPVTNVYSKKTDLTGTANGSGPYFTHFVALVAPTISINTANARVCTGTEAAFIATAANAGINPSYQWKVNGNDAGINSSSYTYTPSDNDQVSCILLPGTGCPVCDAVTSNTVVISVDPESEAGNAAAADPLIIPGSSTTITVDNYTGSIQWQQSPDGSTGWVNVTGGSGSTTPVYTTANLNETTYFKAVVTSGVCTPAVSTIALVTVGISPSFTDCPGDITTSTATGTCNRVVSYSSTASGFPEPALTYSFSEVTPGSGTGTGSGTAFEKGETTVTITAANGVMPNAVCTFTITVVDEELPSISCPASLIVSMNEGCSATNVTTGSPVVSDNCSEGAGLVVSNNAPIVYTEGDNFVVWTVTDESDNVNTCTQTVTVVKNTLSGTLKYNNAAQTPLNNVELTITPAGTNSTSITDAAGNFSFSGLCAGNCTLEVTNIDKPVGYINSTDASAVNAWSIVQTPIERVKWMTGDVTYSGAANSTDAKAIQNFFVYYWPFARGEWSFWKQGQLITTGDLYVEIPVTLTGNLLLNLYGQAVGDFNGSFTPGPMKGASATLDLVYNETTQTDASTEVTLPIRLMNSEILGAVSLILNYPADLFEVTGVEMKLENGNLDWVAKGGELRAGWNTLNPQWLEESSVLMTIHGKISESFGEGDEIRFTLASDPLNELADGGFNVIQDAVLGIDVLAFSTTGIMDDGTWTMDDGSWGLKCQPNPFANFTTLVYTLPVEGSVILEITDMLGRRVALLVDKYKYAGEYSMKLDATPLEPGIYMATLRLKTAEGDFVKTIKLVKNW